MMNIPQKNTQINLHGQDAERADYSANMRLSLVVPAECGGQRLDQILARLLPQHSRNRLQNWIREGRVEVDRALIVEPRHKFWGGEKISVAVAPDERTESAAPENIPLSIVHEDDTLLVIDKPAGLVVHPGSGNWSGTLLNALLHFAPQLDKVPRAGIVHRLDKDTSGLMVVAKTLEAQTDLVRQMQARTVKRYYQALVRGIVDRAGTVDAPIGRHPTLRTKMAVVKTGKPARTHYRVVEPFIDCTLVECALETGRTHQIRVHMTSVAHPLVGDPVYGGGASRIPKGPPFDRQALHARRLGFVHPASGKPMMWKSQLPDDMADLIAILRSEAFEARAINEDEDDWDEDLEGGPEIIYARGDGEGDDEGDDEIDE
jgi:23S rRNA pseudouridine1911/1915/1917 synthase